MSHISTISTEGLEFELPVIRELCKRQGWEFLEGQTSFVWYGRENGKCEHAIRIPGCPYELGLVQGEQGYTALADFYAQGGLSLILGEQGEVFKQLYLQQSDIMWAEDKGYVWGEAPASEATAKKLVLYVNDDFGGGESWSEGGDW